MLEQEEEENKNKKKNGTELQHFFLTMDGKPFDPAKKFGTIEDGT